MNTQDKNKLDAAVQYGEGQFIEFKESFDKNLAKEIVAFANASGGVIYLGITDSGIQKGIPISNRVKSEIQDLARNCDPTLAVSLDIFQNILCVTIPEGANKPYACSDGFFMRMGANSQKMKRDEILSLAVKSGKIRFDEQICNHFEWTDFDDDKFEYYLKLAGISKNLNRDEILTNLRVLTPDGFTHAGVLYFAKEPDKYIISSKIRLVHFQDDDRIYILDKKVIDKGVIGNIEFAVEYLADRIPVKYEIKKLARNEFPEYPASAFREAVVNAVIHCDYYMGDMIAIEKLKHKIVMINKGELLFPEKDFGRRSETRNRLIADLLSRTEYMERAGTGIRRIKDACVSNNNKVSFTFSDAFSVEFLSNKYIQVTDKVTENQQLIIDTIAKNDKITSRQLAVDIGISQRKIKENLKKLKDMGYLQRIGPPKGGHWKILVSDQ